MTIKHQDMSLLPFMSDRDSLLLPEEPITIKTVRNVNNPNSVHGIYPYRGKISAVDASFVVSQLSAGMTLLDPFCGTGTILYEAYKHGLNVIGVDYNPLAVVLSKGKMDLIGADRNKIIHDALEIIGKAKTLNNIEIMPVEAAEAFHETTAEEIMRVAHYFDEMSDYLKAVFFGTICLAARGCNHYVWTSTTVGKDITPKRYINFYEKFLQKVRKHIFPLPLGNVHKIHNHDARKLDDVIEPNIIDYVFTSPPYFDGLDYTSYYAKFVFPIIGMNRSEIRKQLIQNAKTYEDDMRKVLSRIDTVTKENGLIIFVVGDKKMSNGKIVNGGEFFSRLLHHEPSHVFHRDYTTTPSRQIFDKLNKTKRTESIVIWDKSKW